jgi:hypothetical protein
MAQASPDASQMPLNGFDAHFRSFQAQCCRSWRDAASAIAMNRLEGGKRRRSPPVEDALRYAMSLAVCTTVSGIDRSTYCVRIARSSLGMTATELGDDGYGTTEV